jgi:hypothetical protein
MRTTCIDRTGRRTQVARVGGEQLVGAHEVRLGELAGLQPLPTLRPAAGHGDRGVYPRADRQRGCNGAMRVMPDGLLAVGFDHRTARAGGSLLHTHVS